MATGAGAVHRVKDHVSRFGSQMLLGWSSISFLLSEIWCSFLSAHHLRSQHPDPALASCGIKQQWKTFIVDPYSDPRNLRSCGGGISSLCLNKHTCTADGRVGRRCRNFNRKQGSNHDVSSRPGTAKKDITAEVPVAIGSNIRRCWRRCDNG